MPSLTTAVPIDLDRRRYLRLDNRAMFQCEVELSRLWNKKISLFHLLADTDALGLNDLSVLLWMGLVHEDPTLTLVQTQELMDFAQLPLLITAILQAWNNATMPAVSSPAAGEGGDDPLAVLSPGPHSGHSLALS